MKRSQHGYASLLVAGWLLALAAAPAPALADLVVAGCCQGAPGTGCIDVFVQSECPSINTFFPGTTWEIDLLTCDADRLLTDKSRAMLAAPDVSWAPIDRKHFAERLEDARQALNDGFDKNPMFVPLTPAMASVVRDALTKVVLPSWAKRTGADAKPVFNQYLAPHAGMTLP